MSERKQFVIPGRIDSNGKLLLNMELFRQEISGIKDVKISATFEIYDTGDVHTMLSWYRNQVLPRVVIAWREIGEAYTPARADEQLRRLTTTCKKTVLKEEWLLEIEELERPELIKYIDEVKIFCAENLSLII